MNRRGFLKSILAAGVAPYVVTAAGVLMPVRAVVPATLGEIFALGGGTIGHVETVRYDWKTANDGFVLTQEFLEQYMRECFNLCLRGKNFLNP